MIVHVYARQKLNHVCNPELPLWNIGPNNMHVLHVVQLWIDTTGHVGPYILLRLAGARVAAYVHYPTISTDMLARVSRREATFNNSADIAASPLKSWAKVMYYRAFAGLYGCLGGFSNVVLVNSNWTRAHVEQIWWGCAPPTPHGSTAPHAASNQHDDENELQGAKISALIKRRRRGPTVVFPPCDVTAFAALPLRRCHVKCITGDPAAAVLCSVGQFRPEKNHTCALPHSLASSCKCELCCMPAPVWRQFDV
jgi:hypothetical protein